MVHVETLAGDIYLEERSDVNRYTLAFDRLVADALHPDDSREAWQVFISTVRALAGPFTAPLRLSLMSDITIYR